MAVRYGSPLKRAVTFQIPLALLVGATLFPFYWMVITSIRPDGELYRPWNSINYNPFWTTQPTWEHIKGLLEETLTGEVLTHAFGLGLAVERRPDGRLAAWAI